MPRKAGRHCHFTKSTVVSRTLRKPVGDVQEARRKEDPDGLFKAAVTGAGGIG